MKKIGIWIDRKNARILFLNGEEEKFEVIPSGIHYYKHTGFSQARMKWGGPQNTLPAKRMEEKEKNQLKQYFDCIIKVIENADAIIVLGRGQTARAFSARLQIKDKILWTRLKAVIKSDKLSDKQFKSWVRNFYRSRNPSYIIQGQIIS